MGDKTCVIYVRTAASDDGCSVKALETRCREYAAINGFTVAATFSDEGISGNDRDRPGLESALAYIDTHIEVTTFLVPTIPVLSRNAALTLELTGFIAGKNCELIFADMPPVDLGAKMLLAVQQAALELRQRRELQRAA